MFKLIGRDQPKVVLPIFFWHVGVDEFELLVNMNLTLS
jgi:hypothetical protein